MTLIAWADPLLSPHGDVLSYKWCCVPCNRMGLHRTEEAANRAADAHMVVCPKREGDGT